MHSAAAGAAYASLVSLLRQLDTTARLAHHDAYAVDPTVYAATYTASTGASPMGQVKTPSVRESTVR